MKILHFLFLLFPFIAISQKRFDHIKEEFKQNNKYEYVYAFENGYAVFRTFDNTMGVIDSAQNIIIKPVFSFIHNKESLTNLFEVGNRTNKEFKRGFIDLKGNIKIPIIYDQVYYVEGNIILVQKNNKYGVLDTANNIILPVQFDYITTNNHLIIARNKGVNTLYDYQGKQISHFRFSELSHFTNNKAIITFPDKTNCIIGGQAEVILNTIKGYSFEKVLNDDLYLIRNNLNSKKGIVNARGEFLIDCKYDDLQQKRSFFIATSNGKKGFIDLKDSIIKPFIYDEIYSNYFDENSGWEDNIPEKDLENTYTVKIDNLSGVINPNIESDIIPLRYKFIRTLFDKYFIVENTENKNGLFSADGTKIINEEYKFYNVFEGIVFATRNDKCFLIKLEDTIYSRNEILVDEFVEIKEVLPFSKNENQLFKLQGKYGVVNYENKIAIPAVYESIENIYLSNEFIVKKNNKYGVVNSENQIVVDIDNDEFQKSKETILFTKDHKKIKTYHTIRFR